MRIHRKSFEEGNFEKKAMATSYVKDSELLSFFIYNPLLGRKEGTVRRLILVLGFAKSLRSLFDSRPTS